MTYRTDSAQSPPQGAKSMKAKSQSAAPAPAAPAPAAAPAPMGATQIAAHPVVHHQQHLSQTNNLPLPGGYVPAHPQQIGKG